MPRARHPARSFRVPLVLVVTFLALILPRAGWTAVTLGFIEHWAGTSLSGWGGGASYSNPGTGGVLGAGDGFLIVSVTPASNLGTMNNSSTYAGNWTAAGITQVRFWLDDVNAADPLEIHFGIGNATTGGAGNFWQYDTGFIPPPHAWGQFIVDLTSASGFTHIIDSPPGGTFANALTNVNRILIRHDLAPYVNSPDPVEGDFGVDELRLVNSLIVGVEPAPTAAPHAIQLAAPFPNPSRGPVAFSFESFAAEPVRIEIVDVSGRRVRHASLAAQAAGSRLWTWDGLDDGGARAPAGYYRVRAFGPSGGTSRPFIRLSP